MKQVAGFWLPDSETHLVPFLESSPHFYKGPTYQLDKLLGCCPFIKKFGHAIDVGAHCGVWSRVLTRMFKTLDAFEPLPKHIECWRKNVVNPNATLHGFALGTRVEKLTMKEETESTGDSAISPNGKILIQVLPLDSLAFKGVDFIKLDCEGYELFALKGGEQTIKRDKPCIIVEQKPGKAQGFGLGQIDAVDLLKSWGAELKFEQSGDYCLAWN